MPKEKEYDAYATGKDAAYIKPKLVPDYELLARDDSGGPDWEPYTAEFGDGGFVMGEKEHLSAKGGKNDPVYGDEIDQKDTREEDYRAIRRSKGSSDKSESDRDEAPESSKKRAKE